MHIVLCRGLITDTSFADYLWFYIIYSVVAVILLLKKKHTLIHLILFQYVI